MRLDRAIRIRLAVFTVIALIAAATLAFHYISAPATFFGIGRYSVTLELDRTGGLYPSANVTYRGTEIGRVTSVHLTGTGAAALLSLKSGIPVPSDLRAEVHSQSAVGEQYVELLPRGSGARPLKDGDVIALKDASVPPDLDALINAANRGLAAIPQDDLRTTIDESYTAVGGLGPQLTRLVKGSTQLAIDADESLASSIALIERSTPVLDSQADSAGDIRAWAAHLAVITDQLRSSDSAVAGTLRNGGPAADQGRRLFEQLKPTVPLLMANLVSVADVAITYQPAIEQLLVLYPQAVAMLQGASMANLNTKQDYKGIYLDFNLNLNLPPVCNTGFLPPQQQRALAFQDYPARAPGDLYCRVPQDSPFNVRGARNIPCLTRPGKRAPTVKLCESDEEYVPLNDGYNWKGDPNATLSGQDVPQLAPGSPRAPAPPPIAAAEYDPATGDYIGPDGRLYNQSNLSQRLPKEQTWQSMLIPPSTN